MEDIEKVLIGVFGDEYKALLELVEMNPSMKGWDPLERVSDISSKEFKYRVLYLLEDLLKHVKNIK